MTSKTPISVFLKYPDPGKVKTRLAKDTNEEFAANTYKHFVETILTDLTNDNHPYILVIAEKKNLAKHRAWLGKHHKFAFQTGKDLGERLHNHCKERFDSGASKVIIIGTDAPSLPKHTYTDAQNALNTHEAVIGPTEDGGYYLIGIQKEKYAQGLFQTIQWSTKTVYSATMKKLDAANISTKVLPEWYDIDTLDDLKKLQKSK